MLFALPEICRKFQAIIWKYVESRDGNLTADIKQATLRHPSQIFLPLADAMKTATRINIPWKIPSRALISVFTFMHAFTQWKLKMENYLHGSGWREDEDNGFHPLFPPSSNTSQRQAAKGEKKYFKIICAIWFDDVSPANYLMIIYCRCR